MAVKGSKNSQKCTGNSIGLRTWPNFTIHQKSENITWVRPQKVQFMKSRRHARRSFDTLGANDEKPNNKSQTLFFGIPKGTFYKKSPWAGFGAEPHEYKPDSCLQPKVMFAG